MAATTIFDAGLTSFCGDCGTLLPLPGVRDSVVCPRCGSSRPTSDFEGLVSVARTRTFAFQKRTFDTQKQAKEQGATIEEKCPQCGANEMVFHTAQLRSADEGQTVFLSCKCGYKITVNS